MPSKEEQPSFRTQFRLCLNFHWVAKKSQPVHGAPAHLRLRQLVRRDSLELLCEYLTGPRLRHWCVLRAKWCILLNSRKWKPKGMGIFVCFQTPDLAGSLSVSLEIGNLCLLWSWYPLLGVDSKGSSKGTRSNHFLRFKDSAYCRTRSKVASASESPIH